MSKVLVINTGGTIGMVHSEVGNPLSPLRLAKEWSDITSNYPLLNNFNTDYIGITPIDSSDMNPDIWVEIASIVAKKYNKYVGFVILHGTDTMAYTASALSFMLNNLDKPVILTGSQVPLENPRSDALQNLVTAIKIASSSLYNITLVPEVCIFFRDYLLRGNRCRKLDATNYYGFSTPNYSHLGVAGSEIEINKKRIRKPSTDKFFVDYSINRDILIFTIFPGMNINILKQIFEFNNIKGLILKTYGNGNAPTSELFISVIKYIINQGVIVVNVTQCHTGMVKMGLYEASTKLLDIGVVSGLDLTLEAAVTKLMHLLGRGESPSLITKNMQLDICGEQSINLYTYDLDSQNKNSTSRLIEIEVSKNINFKRIKNSRFRIKNINSMDFIDLSVSIKGSKELILENFNKTLKKSGGTYDFLVSFNHSIKKILENSNKLYFNIKSKQSISWDSITLEIFEESY